MSPLDMPPRVTSFERHALEREGLAVPAASGISLTSLGRPIAGSTSRYADAHGNPAPPQHLGRLWVRGPGVMHGYLGQPEVTAQVLQEGWCDTGDQGFFYAEDLYLFGRATDIIIIRGRNYDPAQIEHRLHGIAGLRAGCTVAFGMADLAAVRIASWCWPSIASHHRQRSRRALKPRARRRFKHRATCIFPSWSCCRREPYRAPPPVKCVGVRPGGYGTLRNCNHLERRDCLRCSGKPWRAYGRITKPAKNVNDREAQRAPGASSRVDCGWRARRTCHGTDPGHGRCAGGRR